MGLKVMTIICPKHGLAMREAGDQCVMCNRERAEAFRTRDGQKEMICPACSKTQWLSPKGMEGFFCGECGAKIMSVEEAYARDKV